MEYEIMMQHIFATFLWAVTFMVIMPAGGLLVGFEMARFSNTLEDKLGVFCATITGMGLCWSIGYTACVLTG